MNKIIKNNILENCFLDEYCAFRDEKIGILLYKMNCLDLMDYLIKEYPEGILDMIFADPPYFLSNGGITCHSGKMTTVDKGNWDKSNGIKKNHEFNISWLSKCQKLLKQDGTIWVSGTHHIIYSIEFAPNGTEISLGRRKIAYETT